ncbi:unnamed protein product [Arctogadus glacialis]
MDPTNYKIYSREVKSVHRAIGLSSDLLRSWLVVPQKAPGSSCPSWLSEHQRPDPSGQRALYTSTICCGRSEDLSDRRAAADL